MVGTRFTLCRCSGSLRWSAIVRVIIAGMPRSPLETQNTASYGRYYGGHLLGTPIIEVRNPHNESIKSQLVEYAYALHEQDHGGIASGVAPLAKSGLYESKFDLFRANVPAVQSLKDFCAGALPPSLLSLDQQLRPDSPCRAPDANRYQRSWVHITTDGGVHDVHSHANCSWCGIYYVEHGEATKDHRNGANQFFPPFVTMYEEPVTEIWPGC